MDATHDTMFLYRCHLCSGTMFHRADCDEADLLADEQAVLANFRTELDAQ